MIRDTAQERQVQYSLWELFCVLTALSAYCAAVRSMGHYGAGLLIGVVAQFARLYAMRTSNLMWSAITGAVLATLFMVISAYLTDALSTVGFVATALFYPSLGCLIGVVTASSEFQRTGI